MKSHHTVIVVPHGTYYLIIYCYRASQNVHSCDRVALVVIIVW